jgi:hypothetical protein
VTPLAPSGAVADSDAEECAKRKAIDASIATVESGEAAGQQSANVYPALLAQMAAIEKRISELPPIPWGTCPEHLGIAALSGRLEKVRAPMRQALEQERRRREHALEQERLRQAQERRRQEISAKPWPEKIKRAVLEKQIEIGMTSEQVTASWGRPQSINETITATSRQEQWTYPHRLTCISQMGRSRPCSVGGDSPYRESSMTPLPPDKHCEANLRAVFGFLKLRGDAPRHVIKLKGVTSSHTGTTYWRCATGTSQS